MSSGKADGGSDNRVRDRRRSKTTSSAAAPEEPEGPFSIDPMSLKPLSHALPLPLPVLMLPLLLLILCAVVVMLPQSAMMSASLAVQWIGSKAGFRHVHVLLRSRAEGEGAEVNAK